VAISGGERTRAEQTNPVDLIDDVPAPRTADHGRRTLSVVVPLLNEEVTLEQLYRELEAALAPTELDWEVVFVDDGSSDSTRRTSTSASFACAGTSARRRRSRRESR
jgi:cellulose synthase/poly-beta-1,6-N-acetylglucosamine synthase-like glycosyltransferase